MQACNRCKSDVAHPRSGHAYNAVSDPYNCMLQSTRNARRLSIGSVANGVSDSELMHLFNQAMMAAGCTTSPGPPVVSSYVNPEHRFAFVELRTIAEAANLFVFDGLQCRGVALSVRRPNEYNFAEVRFMGVACDSLARSCSRL